VTGPLENLAASKSATDIKYKGVISSNARVAEAVTREYLKLVKVLTSDKIENATNFFRDHYKWLDDNGMTSNAVISAFERVDHDFKLAVMDFFAII